MTAPGELCESERVPESLVPLLTDLVHGLSRVTPDVMGVWVYGSVALGAFDERSSDIDLIVATNARLSDEQVDRLATLHEHLASRYTLGSRLEVQYLTLPVLRGTAPAADYPVYREGDLVMTGRGDLNATTRWVLREHGIPLLGPPAADLPLDVTWDEVRSAMRFNLSSYWPAYATSAAALPLREDTPVVWTVVTLCRILSTVIDGVIIAKPAAVEIWAERVPDRWAQLLWEVRLLQGHADGSSSYATPRERSRDVQGFVVWACAAGLAVLDRD